MLSSIPFNRFAPASYVLGRCCAQQCCLVSHPSAVLAAVVRLQVKTDWASLIDNWAVRFLHEMDYTREAANANLFRCAA